MASIAQARFQTIPKVRSRISLETGLVFLLLGITFALRVTNLNYNTPFVDEAIYATVGKELLAGQNLQASAAWMFGSYLYPAAASLSNDVAGLVGMRILSAVLTTGAALFVYLTAKRLFNRTSGLWALFIFGMTGNSISVGQYATYDAMGIPFLAMAVFGITAAALTPSRPRQDGYLLFAGLAFALSVLSKYIALLYLPSLIVIGCILFLRQGKSILPIFFPFLAVAAVIIGAYGLYFLSDLITVSKGISSTQFADRIGILRTIFEEIGLAFLLAAAGAAFIGRERLARARTRLSRAATVAAVSIVLVAVVALPAYHVVSSNIRAVEKHTVYALVFIAPLAGYGIYAGIGRLRANRQEWVPRAAAISAILVLLWFTNFSLDRNWTFQNSWPNVSRAVNYLRQQGVNQDSLILASGSAIYEYFFNFDIWTSRSVWFSTWYMKYNGVEGVEAMELAIADHAIDVVLLDDYYTPEMNAVLEPLLEAAGYQQGWQETQVMGNGDRIGIRVFLPPSERGQQ